MKFLIFSIIIFCHTSSLASQSLVTQIQNKIQDMIYKDSQTWKASQYIYDSVTINDADDEGKKIIVKGTFIANVTQWPFKGKKTINFTAEVKKVIDDVTIKKVYWTQPITDLYWCIGDCN